MIKARFDGGCDPNPGGHAACACLIMDGDKEMYRKSKYLGHDAGNSNNVAEFEGVKLILEWLLLNPQPCLIIGDSAIVIGRLKSKSSAGSKGLCEAVSLECKRLLNQRQSLVRLEWQPRTRNEECDAMCDLEIDEGRRMAWDEQFEFKRPR